LTGFRLPCATDRLLLRRFQQSDLERFQCYRRDPEVGRLQGWSAMDDASAAAFLDAMAAAPIGIPGEWFQVAVADRSSDVLIGDIGLCLRDDGTRTAEIGFTIAPAAQGKGLGTEAVSGVLSWLFASGAVDLVEGITDARNASSIRLLERVGMRLLRSQDATFKGEQCTEHVYAIARAIVNGRNPSYADHQ
jgi:RimJ/RimL family protein N-acetyltransferase